MPQPADLRAGHHDGETFVTASYVATLHQRALREGAAGLVRPSGPKPKLSPQVWARAARWRAAGASEAQIGARLGVAQATVSRHLGGSGQQELPGGPGSADRQPLQQGHGAEPERDEPAAERQPEPEPGTETEPRAASGAGLVPARAAGLVPARAAGLVAGTRIVEGQVTSRYAGAMLLHAFGARAGAGGILAAAGDGGPGGYRFADVALLSAVSTCFALGAATIEQVKHLTVAAAGPLAGLTGLPGLRTLRPRLAGIADATDPLELQAMFAAAMLAADPVTSGGHYVDDHFVPYARAEPAGKGWNNKRGRAEKGRADTHVTAHDGRAVCFVTGEPSGLTVTLPKALAELKKAAP